MGIKFLNPYQKQLELLYIVFLLIIGINADGCKTGCPKSDAGKLKYVPGVSYQYNFDSVVTIGVQNAQSEETGMKLKGDAVLYYEGNCAYTLKLDHVEVQTTLEKIRKEMKNDFGTPIQFTLMDGELQPQICADQNDNEFSLNIKRSIASMFQTTNNKYETDVFGVCATETTTSTNDGTQVITKLRNLNACSYRENVFAYYVTGIVNEQSKIKSRPWLNGEYIKEQKLQNGIYQSVELTETYQTPQQTKGKAVVWSKVKSTIKLNRQGSDPTPKILNRVSKSIIFNHPNNKAIKNFEVLRKVFDETVNLVNDYAKADSAQHFSELIRLMRNADTDTLIELSAVRSDLAKKVYFDALIRTGTAESVKAIVKQIGKWNEKEKKIALTSLILVHSVDLDALNGVANLLTPDASREAYLAIGTLVNTFCKKNSCKNNEINTITDKFSAALQNCKANTKKDENHIVSVLKGIGNVQHIADSITQQLIECAQSKHSARIRVAALQAFSASSCNQALQNYAIEILRNRNEDSEIRIESYLAAVNCPNGQIANNIADIMNSETVNQVGGFITSHLKAIRDSTDFTKNNLKLQLGNIQITKKFPIDPRRYSFNSEFSYAIDSLGIGAVAESSVIYSQNGFLPRSLRLNITNEAFGTSFNTFELSMRQENLENVLEHFFGPKGFFSQKPQIILNQINDYASTNRVSRSKRNAQDDSNNMALKYKAYGSDNKLSNDINLDLSMKMFGSELAFLSFGDQIPSSTDELSQILRNAFVDFKNGLKKFEKKIQYHSLIHDMEFVYPTGMGLPLEVAIKSSVTGKLDFGIEIDLDKALENYKNTQFRLKIIPNQDINFETFLRIDSGVLSTGLRTSSNLHSADGGDITVDFVKDDKAGFNIDLKLPRQNVELIEFKHSIDFFVSEQDKQLKVIPFKQNKKRKTSSPVCFPQLQMFGLTICYTSNTDLNSVNGNNKLPFMFNGPMQMSVVLQTEKHITLQGRYNTINDYENYQLMYDTPGSSESHKTDLQLKWGIQPNLFVRVDFVNPQKHLAGESGFINNDKEFVMYCQFEINDEKNVQKIGFTKNGNEYHPLIQMTYGNQVRNDILGYKADGRVIVERGNNDVEKYNFDNFRILTPENKDTVINGWVEYYGRLNGFNSELTVKGSSDKNYKIDLHLKRETPASLSTGLFVTTDNDVDSTLGASVLMEYNKEKINSEIKMQTGKYYLKLHNKLESNAEIQSFENTLEVKNVKETSPLVSGKLNGELSKNLISFELETARSDKIISLNLKMLRNQRVQGDMDLQVRVKLNRHSADLKSTVNIRQNKYFIENVLMTSWGTTANVKGEINQHITAQNAAIDLSGSFKLNNNDKGNTFTLTFSDVQDKMNGEFKLKRENIEILSYICEMQTQPDKQHGSLKMQIKDNLNLNGKFNLNKNGKGDFAGTVHLKKTGKPVKINGKFVYVLPKFNLDTTITFDDKKIVYKTENEYVKDSKLNSKNMLEIGTEKLQFDMITNASDEELNSEILLILPNERKFTGKFNQNSQNNKKQIKMNLMNQQPDGKQQSINYESMGTEFNRDKHHLNKIITLQYKNFDDKTLIASLKFKHLPKDSAAVNTAEFDIDLNGSMLPDSIKLNFNIDEYSNDHIVYAVQSTYGQKLNSNVNGNHQYFRNINENTKSGSYEIKINVNAPETEFKTYTFSSNGKYLSNSEEILRELNLNVNHQLGPKSANYDLNFKGSPKEGSYDIQCHCPKYGSSKITGTWHREMKGQSEQNKIRSGKAAYLTHFESEQFGNADLKSTIDFIENDQYNSHFTITTTSDKLKNLEFITQMKRSSENAYTALAKLNHDNEQYEINSIIYTGLIKSGIDLKIKTPSRQSRLMGLLEKHEDHHIKSELAIENFIDLDLNSKIELDFKSVDDFYIIGSLNSNKLKLDNIKANIRAQNKDIKVNIDAGSTPLLNGNAQYNIKNEKNKIIIEGRGDIMYKNENNKASFKLIRQLFDEPNEQGFQYTFNGELGKKNVVSALKVTTKDFIVKLTGCEESKQCTNFEVQSVVTMQPNDFTNAVHKLMVLIDLREMGYPHELELQSKSTKLDLKFKHEFEITVTSNTNKKYKFIANIKPESNLVQFSLPKRTISLETVNSVPENGLFGKYENSVTFYFDKLNKPQEKATLSCIADLTNFKSQTPNGEFEIQFENPYLQRPLGIKGQAQADLKNRLASASIIFNVFKEEDQKIIAEAKVSNKLLDKQFECFAESMYHSAGLGFNYRAMSLAKFNYVDHEIHLESLAEGGGDLKFSSKLTGKKDKLEAQIIVFNQQLFSMKGQFDSNKNLLKTENTYQVIGSKPIKLITEFLPTKVKIVLKREGLVTATGEFNIGKEVRLQLNKGADNKPIYNSKLSLDPSTFLATTYDVNKEELNNFMKSAETELRKDVEVAKMKLDERFKKASESVKEHLKKAKKSFPDVSKLINNYQHNLKSIIQELEADPSLKKIFTEFHQTYEKLMAILQDLISKSTQLYNKIEAAFSEFYEKQLQLFNETILPALKDLAHKSSEILTELYSEVLKVMRQVFERAHKAWKNFENDIKDLSKPLYELLKPFADIISDSLKNLAKEWKDFWVEMKQYIDKLPTICKNISQKFNEHLSKLRNVDEILIILRDIFQQLETYASSEAREFLTKLYNYIEAKLQDKPVNDVEELEGLYYSFIQAIKMLIIQLTGEKQTSSLSPTSFYTSFVQSITFNVQLLSKLPGWLSIQISLLNYLRNERFDTLKNLLTYKPIEAFDFLPPYQLNGHIADGKHIFTFDGQYLTFPYSCRYVLAQDSVDNNFTIVANLENGKMQSITLVDKSNVVEINNEAIIQLNGKKTEYPVHENGIHAWRRYYTVSMLSTYGVFVKCSLDLRICHVSVNGFYTSKTRGLFGNGNLEQYDDLMKPNGEIVDNLYEFGKEYGLSDCPQAQQITTIANQNQPICNELFDMSSSLLFGYLFVDRKPYREACNVAVQLNLNKETEAACDVALTYASAVRLNKNLPISVPKQCIKCQDSEKLLNYGDAFISKVPVNKADVVVIVDTDLGDEVLNELVQPILNGLNQQFKTRSLDDINVAVINYNNKQKYPSLLTTNGKLNFNGKLTDMTLTGPKYEELSDVGITKVNDILEKLREIRSPITSEHKALELAMAYPFRSDAAKSILLISNDERKHKLMDIIGTPLLNYLFKTKGISLNYVGHVKALTLDSKSPEKLVGFNKKAIVYLNGLAKRQKLEYENDSFINTVVEDDSWIFVLNYFKQLKQSEKKQFAMQIASMISDQLYKTEITSNCECSLKYGLHGETKCTKTSSDYVPTKKHLAQKQG